MAFQFRLCMLPRAPGSSRRSSQILPCLTGERSFPMAETNPSWHLHKHHQEGKSQIISRGDCQPSSTSGCGNKTPVFQIQPARCRVLPGNMLSVVGYGRRACPGSRVPRQGVNCHSSVPPLPWNLGMGRCSCMSGNKRQYRKLPAWQDVFFRRRKMSGMRYMSAFDLRCQHELMRQEPWAWC